MEQIIITGFAVCETCRGTGWIKRNKTCKKCEGKGKFRIRRTVGRKLFSHSSI